MYECIKDFEFTYFSEYRGCIISMGTSPMGWVTQISCPVDIIKLIETTFRKCGDASDISKFDLVITINDVISKEYIAPNNKMTSVIKDLFVTNRANIFVNDSEWQSIVFHIGSFAGGSFASGNGVTGFVPKTDLEFIDEKYKDADYKMGVELRQFYGCLEHVYELGDARIMKKFLSAVDPSLKSVKRIDQISIIDMCHEFIDIVMDYCENGTKPYTLQNRIASMFKPSK